MEIQSLLKRSLLFLILSITVLLCPLKAWGEVYAQNLIENLDLSGLNDVQKSLVRDEFKKYAGSLGELYKTDKEEYKRKVNELFVKIRIENSLLKEGVVQAIIF